MTYILNMIDKFIHNGIIDTKDINMVKNYAKTSNKRIVYLDATFVLPTSSENIKQNFLTNRIENSIFFDTKHISDHNSHLPNMIPNVDYFSSALSDMGINNSDIIVIYGQHSITMGPARAWWMLKGFGHKEVMVLNGSLSTWIKDGLTTENGEPKKPERTEYVAQEFNSSMIANINSVNDVSTKNLFPIIDARPEKRFLGTLEEPRKGMRSGHIPNSINIPCSSLITEDGLLKTTTELKKLFISKGLDVEKPSFNNIITTCGSGITACSLSLALHNISYDGEVMVYDGSWSEWGQDTSPTLVVR